MGVSVLIPLEQGIFSDGVSEETIREGVHVLIPLEQGIFSDREGGVEACGTRAEKIGYQLFDEAEDRTLDLSKKYTV